jgi:hypothetical protein
MTGMLCAAHVRATRAALYAFVLPELLALAALLGRSGP